MEIVGFYNKIKQILSAYSQIPDIVKTKVSEVLGKDKK